MHLLLDKTKISGSLKKRTGWNFRFCCLINSIQFNIAYGWISNCVGTVPEFSHRRRSEQTARSLMRSVGVRPSACTWSWSAGRGAVRPDNQLVVVPFDAAYQRRWSTRLTAFISTTKHQLQNEEASKCRWKLRSDQNYMVTQKNWHTLFCTP